MCGVSFALFLHHSLQVMCVHMEQQKMGEGHFYEEQYLKRIEEYILICSSHLMSSYSTPVIPGITPVIPDITPLLQYLVIQLICDPSEY